MTDHRVYSGGGEFCALRYCIVCILCVCLSEFVICFGGYSSVLHDGDDDGRQAGAICIWLIGMIGAMLCECCCVAAAIATATAAFVIALCLCECVCLCGRGMQCADEVVGFGASF